MALVRRFAVIFRWREEWPEGSRAAGFTRRTHEAAVLVEAPHSDAAYMAAATARPDLADGPRPREHLVVEVVQEMRADEVPGVVA